MEPANEEIVRVNGIDLCVDTLGDPADPAILLIMGSSASLDWWEDEFCERLAAGSRFVIRYDHRDTGRSVNYEPGAPRYDRRDMTSDAVGLLDTFDLAGAHLVGMSLGSAIVQLAAVHHPDRVSSLTLIAAGPSAPGPDDPDLPQMSQETIAAFTTIDEPDWADRSAVIDYGVQLARASASRSRPFDEENMRELWGRVFDRTANVQSTIQNHNAIDHGDRWRDRLGEVRAPTLVIHGTEDPVVPYGNALALAKELPDTRLIALEGTGHELPRRDWDVVVPAILEHTSRGRSR